MSTEKMDAVIEKARMQKVHQAYELADLVFKLKDCQGSAEERHAIAVELFTLAARIRGY